MKKLRFFKISTILCSSADIHAVGAPAPQPSALVVHDEGQVIVPHPIGRRCVQSTTSLSEPCCDIEQPGVISPAQSAIAAVVRKFVPPNSAGNPPAGTTSDQRRALATPMCVCTEQGTYYDS